MLVVLDVCFKSLLRSVLLAQKKLCLRCFRFLTQPSHKLKASSLGTFKPNPFSHFQTPCLYSWVWSLFTSLVYTAALTESFDLAAYSRSLVFAFVFSFRLLADASMTSELFEALLFFSFFFLSSFFSLDVSLSFFGGSLELPAASCFSFSRKHREGFFRAEPRREDT